MLPARPAKLCDWLRGSNRFVRPIPGEPYNAASVLSMM
jgi:hypothetical protein